MYVYMPASLVDEYRLTKVLDCGGNPLLWTLKSGLTIQNYISEALENDEP